MNKADINIFIDEMKTIGDYWTPEQVENVYGALTIEEALIDRKTSINIFADIISKVLNN